MRPPRRLLPPSPAVAAALVAAALASPPAAFAHDFWIEPSTYRPAPSQRVTLRHRVGNSFLGDPVPRDESLLVLFVAVDRDGSQPVPGVHGVDPAGIAQAPAGGTLVVAYQSGDSVAEMTPDWLARYVEEEQIAAQLPARWESAWRGRPLLRDRFSRAVKTLLVVRGGDSGGFDRVVGLPLELVPLADPARLVPGGALPVRLLWQGKPAAGIQVIALSRVDPSKPIGARTDAAGGVTLVLPRAGEWLLKAVKILPDGGAGADFASVWTSLTFATGKP
jgi:hypothetical protein